MRNYELIFIVQPDQDETAIAAITEKVQGWITEAGGSVVKVDNWGKKRMAYAINKRRDGYYVFIEATMLPTFCVELERNLRMLESIMRFSLIVQE